MFYRADMTAALAPQQNALWGFEPLTANPVTSPWRQLDPDSSVLHQPNWLQGADGAFQELEADVEWRSMQRPMYDRIVDVPRLISTLAPRSPATPSTVRRIVEHAEQLLGVQVEHVGPESVSIRSGLGHLASRQDRPGTRLECDCPRVTWWAAHVADAPVEARRPVGSTAHVSSGKR
ncbi:hypothetical protein GQR58_030256 [Nymphon striatum]|nr:hypothetical protein GQR58_030256 [Nymphon striatum]